MEAITTLTLRPAASGPVTPVSAIRPVTRDGAGPVTLAVDAFRRSAPPAPAVTYGRDGTGGTARAR